MSFNGSSSDGQEIYQYTYSNLQPSYGHPYDGNSICPAEESNYWSSNSPRSDSPSPGTTDPIVGPYQIYTPLLLSNDVRHSICRTGYEINSLPENETNRQIPFVRVVRRRTTANKKERRRTQSINNAYAELRDCIPNVPQDTKLSKIKTLRLATSYISYLMDVLETNEPAGTFKAEIGSSARRSSAGPLQVPDCSTGQVSPKSDISEDMSSARRSKGRTGWPQHVWALELKQEQTH